ncbi:MAG: hypothetical protein QXI58_01435 [Candidatus Micrarchaeia archaeon]
MAEVNYKHKDIRYPELPDDKFIQDFWDFLIDAFYLPVLYKIRKVFLDFENIVFRGILSKGLTYRKDFFKKANLHLLEFFLRRGNIYDLMAQFILAGWEPTCWNFCLKKEGGNWSYKWFTIFKNCKEYEIEKGVIRTPYYYFRLRASYGVPSEEITEWTTYNEIDFEKITNFFTWTFRAFTPIEVIYDFSLDIGEDVAPFQSFFGKGRLTIYSVSAKKITTFFGK